MNPIEKALEFEQRSFSFKNTSERIMASREVKQLILDLNDEFKSSNDSSIMDIMKRLTTLKRKIEKRLKGRPLTT